MSEYVNDYVHDINDCMYIINLGKGYIFILV